jgi:hypothetical protein
MKKNFYDEHILIEFSLWTDLHVHCIQVLILKYYLFVVYNLNHFI